jgi:hypothetical protein
MIEIKYKFQGFAYKWKMFLDEGYKLGDIIQAEDPLRYIIWDCEIIDIFGILGQEIILKKLRPNEIWYKSVLREIK